MARFDSPFPRNVESYPPRRNPRAPKSPGVRVSLYAFVRSDYLSATTAFSSARAAWAAAKRASGTRYGEQET